MPKRFRLAVFDLDNTLVGHSLKLSPQVKAAVAAARAGGVEVSLATGRGPRPAAAFAAELELTAPLICFQGGLVYDYRADQVLHEIRLDPAVIPLAVRLAAQHGWNLEFETPDMIYLSPEAHASPALMNLLKNSPWKRVNDFALDLPEVPHKFIFAVNDPAERDSVETGLRAALEAAGAPVSVTPSHPNLVEGLPRGSNKAVGLAWLAERLGVAREEVLAMGDNDNDAEMLRWAGLGVAVSNASPAALAAADWIAPPVEEEGAAVVIERYLL